MGTVVVEAAVLRGGGVAVETTSSSLISHVLQAISCPPSRRTITSPWGPLGKRLSFIVLSPPPLSASVPARDLAVVYHQGLEWRGPV